MEKKENIYDNKTTKENAIENSTECENIYNYTITITFIGDNDYIIEDNDDEEVQKFKYWLKDRNDNVIYEVQLENEILYIKKENILYVSIETQ